MLHRRISYGFFLAALSGIALTPRAVAQEPPPALPADNRPRVAVIDITPGDGVDARDTWIGTAVQDVLTWRLRRVPKVVAIPSVRFYQARQELSDDPKNPPAWPRVAELLGATQRLSGHFTGLTTGVTLDLELTPVGDGAKAGEAKAAKMKIGPAPLFDALDEATRWLLARLDAGEIDDALKARIFGPPCKSTSTLEYATKASLALIDENTRDAVYYGEMAIQYDPLYRPAQLLLAQIDVRRSASTRSQAAIRLRQVAMIADQTGDRLDRIEAELLQAIVLQLVRSDEPAQQRFQNALDWADEIHDPYSRIAALSAMADLFLTRIPINAADLTEEQRTEARKADSKRATSWQQAVLRDLAAIHDQVAEAPAANKLALIYEQLGDSKAALEMHQRTLDASQRVGSRRTQATAWMFIGQWYRRNDNLDQARTAFEKCFELATESAKPTVRIALADIEQAAGHTDKALDHLQKAYDAIKDGDDLVNQLRCLRSMAEIYHGAGRGKEAQSTLQNALDIATALELPEKDTISKQLADWRAGKP